MDLASGYSDSINYGNGYTPLATGAINNNNAAFAQQQAMMAAYAQAMQNNVFSSGGGFGAQTDYYSGLGRDYTTATGGNIYGGNSFSGWPGGGGARPQIAIRTPGSDGGNESVTYIDDPSFNDRFSAAPAITPGLQPQGGDYSAFPNAISAGVDPSRNVNVGNSSFNSRFGAFPDPATPMYTPQDFPGWNPGGGAGATAASQALMLQNPAEYYRQYGGGTQTPAPFGGPDTNTYGYPGSGSLGTMNGFGGYQPDTPLGQGGIGSDTSRDRMAWMLAQQSPWATPGAPANGPYPNLGYNPAMSNYFANPAMQQYDWTANNAKMIQEMQRALGTIDSATGRQPAQPYGGQLPDFWQGVRDWTGMGAPQPTPGPQSNADGITPFRDTWTNAS